MNKILLIEDDNEMNEMICTFLKNNYDVTSAFSGTEGLLLFKTEKFDLILLDRMLPGKSGEDVLKEIRLTSNIPIIILTAMSEKEDITRFLLSGANDYITKPFNIDELKARIVVQLRNLPQKEEVVSEVSTYKALSLVSESFSITCGSTELILKRKEFEILKLLIENPKKVYTKELLYEAIWKEPYYGDENTINVHISNLRRKLKSLDPSNDYISTVWGIGIKLA